MTVPEWLFRNLLMASLRSKAHFDEAFYLSSYVDIRSALKREEITSAEEHYYITGYFESRLPKRSSVDERYYVDQDPDIAEAMRRGIVKNAQQHFDSVGFQEGRVPTKTSHFSNRHWTVTGRLRKGPQRASGARKHRAPNETPEVNQQKCSN